MPTTWFTGDLHVGHRNIIEYCHRSFPNTNEMDSSIVSNWNAVVQPEDSVYILGDLAHGTSPGYAAGVMKSLVGQKHVIEGNHDYLAKQMFALCPDLFASWDRMSEIEVEGQRIVLCHYAMREWNDAILGVWHLFVHTHSRLGSFGKSVDVGIDNSVNVASNAILRPLSFHEIKSYMEKQPIGLHTRFCD